MAKQREAIAMSEAEILALFDECRSLNVATNGRDGYPHQTTLWFAPHQGALLFETYGKSQKAVNLRRDPRVSVLCEAGETYGELRGVSIRGRAEIVDAEPRLTELMRVILRRSHGGLSEEELSRKAAGMARKRVVVVVHPERSMSWDHRKLTPAG